MLLFQNRTKRVFIKEINHECLIAKSPRGVRPVHIPEAKIIIDNREGIIIKEVVPLGENNTTRQTTDIIIEVEDTPVEVEDMTTITIVTIIVLQTGVVDGHSKEDRGDPEDINLGVGDISHNAIQTQQAQGYNSPINNPEIDNGNDQPAF